MIISNTEKTKIKKDSIRRKRIIYAFICFLTLTQLLNTQRHTSNVLKIMKNKDIPSTPKKKFILKKAIQLKNSMYWKLEVELSKKIHKYSDNKKVIAEFKKAICLIKLQLLFEIVAITKIPIRGKSIREDNIII